jgi:anhydro-N-acetylmuramic acid kinase
MRQAGVKEVDVLYLGLMSGTSMDGIDIAALRTDGSTIEGFGPVGQRAYSADERGLLSRAMIDAQGLTDRAARTGVLADAEGMITKAHAELVARFLHDNSISISDVCAVGFHGQTVLHRPEKRLTVQIGEGASLAELTGVPVVWDMRAADVAAGGQGAPLVPVYHQALALGAQLKSPWVIVNLGGVGNVTYGDDKTLLAFDTGPANALLDDWMQRHTGDPIDRDGKAAAEGRVAKARIVEALQHPFLDQPPPRSADRHDFDVAAARLTEGLSLQDGAATLTAYSAACLEAAVRHFPMTPESWVITGGGARNPVLMQMLSEMLPGAILKAESLGWQAEYIEAQAFAYLAARSLKGWPLTFPGTTGVNAPLTGGLVSKPD